MLWSDVPRPALPAGGLDRRFRALNDLIARGSWWRHVVTLPLAAHVDGAGTDLGRAARPDGIHFTADAATSLADGWLVDEIVVRTQQATAEASPCRTTTGAGATDRARRVPRLAVTRVRQEMTKSSRSGLRVQSQ